ncbi:RNA polymerase sigma factor [Phytoactinopolyspora halotolerans]|uniref:RNA polymerase sigma factor n=1 Tax=Phytoactinopolyspora halotolerans TaxID=1981512 RepID=A0A6L9SE02_9ACTN|nr:RNA polymerase sigma factor [Phytoactinopolyspora halotolerans]NEE02844.1 RNA polymerase sigma factor [Phytoactinopolyspora halotolerans]
MREECPEPSDVELWDRAAGGDADAFGLLFDRHATAVYNFCFRRIGSWIAAEDLTSVVFMQAWRRRKDVKPHGDDLLPWLLAVADKVVGNAYRSRRRHRALLAKLAEEPPTHDHAEDVAARVDDERAMRRILEALARLPKKEREVVELCVLGELTYADAATALGIPIGTVRSRLSHARKRLREFHDPQSGMATTPVPKTTEVES